jgi:hypothetical protein
MSPWEEPYEPDDDDETPVYQTPPDEISQGVDGSWYATDYTLDECRPVYPGSAIVAYPERFDRFYMRSSVGPLLIDVLAGDGDQMEAQRARKHVAFKEQWCAEHGRRYLALEEADLSADKIRALLAGTPDPVPAVAPAKAAKPRRSGGIQRPKATA